MAVNIEQVNKELYGFLASKGLDPSMIDMDGKAVATPNDAISFQFKFKEDGIEYDDVTISIDANRDMTVYCDNEVARGPNRTRSGESGWLNFEKALKEFALRKCQLRAFHISNQSNLKHDMMKRKSEDEFRLNEGYRAINKKTSMNDKNPSVKVVLKHSKTMEEGEQRFRHVEKIFLETSDGQRFLAPTQSSAVAALYARHLAEGGLPYCEKWNHIGSLVEEYSKMKGFVNATKNKEFNESTQELVSEAVNHYQSLRETLKKLGGKRGYNAYFENWTPTLMEDEDDGDMTEMFVNPSIDARIMEAMPILRKLQKKTPDITEKMGNEFESWANDITESPKSEDDAHKGLFGVDESVEDGDEEPDTKPEVADYVDPEEADYDDEYDQMVTRAGKFAKGGKGHEMLDDIKRLSGISK